VVPRHRDSGGVPATVEETVVHPGQPVVVDPDAAGGVELDGVVVVGVVAGIVPGISVSRMVRFRMMTLVSLGARKKPPPTI
jgi:hypothetical protein